MLNPNDTMVQGGHYYFNFDHYGFSVYPSSSAVADLYKAGLPIQIIDAREHWVGDITIEFIWYGDRISVQNAGELFADAMSVWWQDLRISFNSASLYASEASVNPDDDITNAANDTFARLNDMLNKITDNIPLVLLGLGILVFLNFGGSNLVRGAVKSIKE